MIAEQTDAACQEPHPSVEWGWRIISFCLCYGPPLCFQGWEPQRMKDYVLHHLEHGTMAVQMSGRQVEGILVGWQDYECKMRARAAAGEHPWDWQGSAPGGDCIYLAECVARSYPDGAIGRRTVARLVEQLGLQFPAWRGLKWLAYRHGRLVRLDRMAEGLGIGRRGSRPYRRS